MMSVIPWVACKPSVPAGAAPTATPAKPLFLFLEGIDAHDHAGGDPSSTSGGAILPPVKRFSVRGRERSDGASTPTNSRRSAGGGGGSFFSFSPASSTVPAQPATRCSPEFRSDPGAALSMRPIEVIVYASLSFRNLLPVGVGWRVVGARGNPDARVAEGWLGPGEGVHVLEANTMAMTPSLSFQVRYSPLTSFCFVFLFPTGGAT